jgi:serine/threonine protein kinase
MMDRTGNQLGNYRLIRLIGKGGFADVYLGEHIYLQTQAAIKILHTRLTPETMNNFLSEAKTIARLAHPHIVRVLDFGVDNDTPFLVMEYAPNSTLRQRHPQGMRLSLPTVVSYVKQIASALQYAHDQRLIHRDVKPENMLLGRNYEVLLSDFGIATISQTSRSLPTLDVSGTISYMAPEQIQGKPRPASDQYSLGIIIYEWLTGACPFKGSFPEIATQHMFTTPPSLRVAYPLLSPDVERVVMVALSKNPEERFARVEAFAFALEQACQIELPTLPGSNLSPLFPSSLSPTVVAAPARDPLPSVSPVNTGPHHLPPPDLYVPIPGAQQAYHVPSPVTPVPPVLANSTTSGDMPALQPQRKVSRRAFVGGAVLLAVAAGSGVAWTKLSPVLFPSSASSTGNSSHPAPTRPAKSGTASQSTPASQSSPTGSTNSLTLAITRLYTYPGPAEEYTVAWAPGGQYFACAGNSPKIEILNSTTGSVVFTLNDNFNLTDNVAWSPNGHYLASGHDDSIVRIWDATNGTLVSRLTGHRSHVNSVAWSPDNAMIVSGSGDKTARVWDIATGNSLVTYTGHAHYINSVAWAHFGTRVVSGSGDYTAQVWDAASGLRLATYSLHSSDVLALAWSPDDQRIASASDDSTVQIWNSTNGTRYITYSGHRSFVVSVAWSPDGMKIVSGGGDHTKPVSDTSVQVWDPHTGKGLVTYHDHQSEVESVAWASDSSRIASASDDATVRVWRVS